MGRLPEVWRQRYRPLPGTDGMSEKDWRLWEFWVRRVGRHNAEICRHDPECRDGEAHMRAVLRVLRASGH